MRTVTQFNILTASIDAIEKLQSQLAQKIHHVISVSERDEHLIFRLENPVNVIVPQIFSHQKTYQLSSPPLIIRICRN